MMPSSLAMLTALSVAASDSVFVRVNQIGYQPDAPKVAVVCALKPTRLDRFSVVDASGRVVTTRRATRSEPFAACANTWRLDFSSVRAPGTYHIDAQGVRSVAFRIGTAVYAATADTMLFYMRQQRSGYNPVFGKFLHSFDAIIVDDSVRGGEYIPVTGGWADASDYLQYVTTSANATFVMLMAYRDHPEAFGDEFLATGDSGRNGTADVLDEARHGLEWLLRMYPSDEEMYNQLGDDRDHAFPDVPASDSSEYGWGKGQQRPVYPCTGKPQGLIRAKNRADGYASTAGKYAAAFAVAAQLYARSDTAFAAL